MKIKQSKSSFKMKGSPFKTIQTIPAAVGFKFLREAVVPKNMKIAQKFNPMAGGDIVSGIKEIKLQYGKKE